MQNPLLDYIITNKQDAVIYKATELFRQAGGDTFAEDLVLSKISDMLSYIESDLVKDNYTTKIAKLIKVKPAIITKLVKKDSDKKQEESIQYVPEGKKALPKWINKEKFYTRGFDMRTDVENIDDTGIYFASSNNEARQLTNFSIKPIVHIKSDDSDSNRRLTEIDNGWTKEVIELPSKAWSSPDMFESILLEKGVFMTYDGFSKSHLSKLKAVLLREYVICRELNKLGWQSQGFFAFSNAIYKDGIIEYNEYGVAEVEGTNYLSMSASNALMAYADSDDEYENDKFLRYVLTDLTFTRWTKYMVDVYGDSGMMGVCYVLIACFKDIIFRRNNNCPLPYAFGAVQSGKTKFTESVSSVFMVNMPGYNLNQGTDYALFQRLERFYNVPMVFNEFDENSLPEARTKIFKGAFDGEGREKGSGKKGKSKTQKINCLAFLVGQFLTTSDDGSLLQRMLPEKFTQNNNRTDEQIRMYNELKEYEKNGITSISCELIAQRKYVQDNYIQRFDENTKIIKNALAKEDLVAKNRIVENYTNAYTMVDLISDKINFGFDKNMFFKHCIRQIVSLSSVVSESNALSEFWKTMEFLVNQGHIEQGYDYKIETVSTVTVSAGRDDRVTKTFPEPKKIIFIRFNTIHSYYLKEKKLKTGKPGLNAETIQIYMKEQDSYIGNNPSSKFKSKRGMSTNTSSYVFDYDKLNVNLDMYMDQEEESKTVTIDGEIHADATLIDFTGIIKLRFTLVKDESYFVKIHKVEKKTYTTCYYKDTDELPKFTAGKKIRITGTLDVRQKGDTEYRIMEVKQVDFGNEQADLPF
jgi:hypothetical protein